jgi:hypothetical protein
VVLQRHGSTGRLRVHPALRQLLDRTLTHFQQDARVIAAFHSGSIGTEHEDDYSDVDPVFVIAPAAFAEVDAELPALFERLCGPVHLWWPERGNCDTWRNYACLFDAGGTLLQYDITIMLPPATPPLRVAPKQFLFDKAGLLAVAPQKPQPPAKPERLLWTVQRYWLYVFIHAKYLRRGASFKLAFAQQQLFQDHLEVVRICRQTEPGWWPAVAREVVPSDRCQDMLLYFGPPHPEAVSAALTREMDAFSRDARAACAYWGVPYCDGLELIVRAHVER